MVTLENSKHELSFAPKNVSAPRRSTPSAIDAEKLKINNLSMRSSTRSYRRLPRPSSAKLDQIFNFNFDVFPEVKARPKNGLSQDFERSNGTGCAKPNSQINRFGFSNPYQKDSVSTCSKLQSSKCSVGSKHTPDASSGLNMNLNESPSIEDAYLVSTSNRRSSVKPSFYIRTPTGGIAPSSLIGSRNNSPTTWRRSSSSTNERRAKSNAYLDKQRDKNAIQSDRKQPTRRKKVGFKCSSTQKHSTLENKFEKMTESERDKMTDEQYNSLSETSINQEFQDALRSNCVSQNVLAERKADEDDELALENNIPGDFKSYIKPEDSSSIPKENESSLNSNSRNSSTCSLASGNYDATSGK